MRIELQDVRKNFGATQVLRGITLDLPEGARVALIGPNGSGKSTLLRALLGLVACEGRVRLGGRSPFDDRSELAAKLAYVPQIAPNLQATTSELLRAIATLRGLELSQIAKAATAMQLDVEAIRGRPFRALSGGMKQKLLIALALASRPALMVMDEPTASLDASARDRFFRLFDELPESCTVLLCSHRLEELRSLSDRVVSLEEGRVRWSGTAADFLSARSMSVLEIYLDRPDAEGWLVARGFQSAVAGCWTRTVSQSEKLSLLPDITRSLGDLIANVQVRDLESVDVPRNGAIHG